MHRPIGLLAKAVMGLLPGEPAGLAADPSSSPLRLVQAFLMAAVLEERTSAEARGTNSESRAGVGAALDAWSEALLDDVVASALGHTPKMARAPLGRCIALCAALRDPGQCRPASRQWLAATDRSTPVGAYRSVFSDLECRWLRGLLEAEEGLPLDADLYGCWQHPVDMAGGDFDYTTHAIWYATCFGTRIPKLGHDVVDAVSTAVLWSWLNVPALVEALLALGCLGGWRPPWFSCAVAHARQCLHGARARGVRDAHWLAREALFEAGLAFAGAGEQCSHTGADHAALAADAALVFRLVDAARRDDCVGIAAGAAPYFERFGATPTLMRCNLRGRTARA
jgi:hypothetical protein